MNHGYPPRGVVPPTAGPSQRLNELLDSVRAEFENESQRSVEYESTSEFLRSNLSWTHSSRYAALPTTTLPDTASQSRESLAF
jgi:hypothetical protein